MYRRRFVFFVVIALMLTGCTRVTDDMDKIINATIIEGRDSVNTVSTGYELYIPIGVSQVEDNEYNQKFKIRDRYVFLYVDVISYYYKNTLNYKSNNDYNYYYREIVLNDKSGYVGINKIEEDLYFCSIVYNYSKIEFYSNEDDLPVIFSDSLIILNSIKYNDNLIKNELENSTSDGREIKYELEKPKDSESTFSDVLQEFVVEDDDSEVSLPDDD